MCLCIMYECINWMPIFIIYIFNCVPAVKYRMKNKMWNECWKINGNCHLNVHFMRQSDFMRRIMMMEENWKWKMNVYVCCGTYHFHISLPKCLDSICFFCRSSISCHFPKKKQNVFPTTYIHNCNKHPSIIILLIQCVPVQKCNV